MNIKILAMIAMLTLPAIVNADTNQEMVTVGTKYEMYRSIIHPTSQNVGLITYGNAGGIIGLTMSGIMEIFTDNNVDFSYLLCNNDRCLTVTDTATIQPVGNLPENEIVVNRNGYSDAVYYTLGERIVVIWLTDAGSSITEDWQANPDADIEANPLLPTEQFSGTVDEAALILRDELLQNL